MNGLIIDAGTTNARVTLIDGEGRIRLQERRAAGARDAAVSGGPAALAGALRDAIGAILARAGLTAADVDACAAYGMITSNVGLCEVPHVTAPAGPDALRAGIVRRTLPQVAPFPIDFLPGVRNAPGGDMDMMRGEETEAVGLYSLLRPGRRCVFVLPGSHDKFVAMGAQGEILGCMTALTGELLDALTHHTILADAVGGRFVPADGYDPARMRQGLEAALAAGLGRAAFAGRTLRTLGGLSAADAANYLLGAALSQDVLALRAFSLYHPGDPLYVCGKPPVQQALCDALRAAGLDAVQGVDGALGREMGVRGARIIHGGMSR